MTGYRTVKGEASAEFVERKSRFIGHIAPVTTEDGALGFIERISKQNRDASHNVFAYILREGNLSRCSDNGEPQGTAGVPTLDVLQKAGVTDVCAVVTRYFGGVLLGTGGLVRAYSHAVTIGLEAAGICSMVPCTELAVECEYSFYGKLSYILPEFHIETLSSDFGEAVCLNLLLRSERLPAFQKELTDLSNGRVLPQIIGERFAERE